MLQGTPSRTHIETRVLDGVLEHTDLETARIHVVLSSFKRWASLPRGGRSQGSPLQDGFCRGESCIRPSLDSSIVYLSTPRFA
jgi:hypothetical protein